MPHLPELSKKEPSTKAIIDNNKMRDEEIAESESRSNPEARLAEGARYDRNKAPDLQDRDKARTEKVHVEGGASSSMYGH
ncbi:uncharacterized protein BDV17DRAFT_75524 [Aspergillus undulatus]|uniref:uncharacterized protein n=1 Tax=Aspergillus undulatus TaxID=1810928 RepID=UPI003CCE3DD5